MSATPILILALAAALAGVAAAEVAQEVEPDCFPPGWPDPVLDLLTVTTTVDVLTGNATWEGDRFLVDKLNERILWEINYHLTNKSVIPIVFNTSGVDSYGPELSIEWADATSGVVTAGQSDREEYGQLVRWKGFSLGPFCSATLTVVLSTWSCQDSPGYRLPGNYILNKGIEVSYSVACGFPERAIRGEGYRVEVVAAPHMRLSMSSPTLEWMIKKPGDYYIRAFTGTVTADAPVVVTFSDFGNLENSNTGEVLPVYYSLQTQQPDIDDWMSPVELNSAFLEVPPAQEPVEWALWQRVVLGTQGVGTYEGEGVITFTMLNVQDAVR